MATAAHRHFEETRMRKNTDICTMHIIVAAATALEIEPFLTRLQNGDLHTKGLLLEPLITGVGILASSHAITAACNKKPSLIIQAGIAGSFNPKFPPGAMTLVKEEISGDCGVTENGVFKDIFDLQFAEADKAPFTGKKMINPSLQKWEGLSIPLVTGLTVNQISTGDERIKQLKEKYQCDIESMEGASLHYACLNSGIEFLQLRAISNFVGIRDKKEWKIKDAITILNNTLFQTLQILS